MNGGNVSRNNYMHACLLAVWQFVNVYVLLANQTDGVEHTRSRLTLDMYGTYVYNGIIKLQTLGYLDACSQTGLHRL